MRHVYPQSDHYDGKKFHNLDPLARDNKNFFEVLKWKIRGGAENWPQHIENTRKIILPKKIQNNEVYITFISHATELIQMKDVNILTDPVFSLRASPFSFIGPKRVRAPAINIRDLPKIHYVLISHNHYDHMDVHSLKEIYEKYQPTFVVPLGNAKFLKKFGIDNIIELDWWQSYNASGRTFILTPAQHWSARGLFDKNEALWGGFLIKENNLKIFFAGDTGYNSHFKEIHKRYGTVDVSILPIGSYEPRWFMKTQHINPDEAVKAHLDLGSKLSIGMHFGTFQLTDEGIDKPVIALKEACKKYRIDKEKFIAPDHGQTVRYKK